MARDDAGVPPPTVVKDSAPQLTQAFPSPDGAPSFGPATISGEIGRLGKYRIQRELGRGGMGAVYLAFDERLQRKVALKVMLPKAAADATAKERFLREARAAARISSDHVVGIYEADEIDGIPYIALQFLQGLPLDEYLRKKGNPTLPQAVRIGAETALGLAKAHKLGLVHRDIKPGNLWLEAPNGRVKILDFGLAKPALGQEGVELTGSGAIVGTPAYMPPEQGLGRAVDHRADLFSLGCLLYRLCTGKLPFDRPTVMAVLAAIATEEPVPVRDLNPSVPEPLADLIHRLMAKDPADRPATAADVVKELDRISFTSKNSSPEVSDSQPQVIDEPIPLSLHLEQNPLAGFDDATEHDPSADSAIGSKARKSPAILIGSLILGLTIVIGGVMIAILADKGPKPEVEEAKNTAKEKSSANKNRTPNPEPLQNTVKEKSSTPIPMDVKSTLPPADFTNSIGMEFMKVPKGTAWLHGIGGKLADNKVLMYRDFYIGKYEVTQEEWQKVTGLNPSHFSRSGPGKTKVMDVDDADLRRFPVEDVSWNDCQFFLDKLNRKENEPGWKYRLPTAEESEYACRGGPIDKKDSGFDYYFQRPANKMSPDQANFAYSGSLKRTCKVGTFEPNALGIHDMHGNVCEWLDGTEKWAQGPHAWHRHGAYNLGAEICRAADRNIMPTSKASPMYGLRVVRVSTNK